MSWLICPVRISIIRFFLNLYFDCPLGRHDHRVSYPGLSPQHHRWVRPGRYDCPQCRQSNAPHHGCAGRMTPYAYDAASQLAEVRRRGSRSDLAAMRRPKNLAELAQWAFDQLYLQCGIATDRYPASSACGTSETLTYQCHGLVST